MLANGSFAGPDETTYCDPCLMIDETAHEAMVAFGFQQCFDAFLKAGKSYYRGSFSYINLLSSTVATFDGNSCPFATDLPGSKGSSDAVGSRSACWLVDP